MYLFIYRDKKKGYDLILCPSTHMSADALWHTAGPGVPQHGAQTNAAASPTNVFVMPNSQFQNVGQLIEFEYYVVTTGSVTFYVRFYLVYTRSKIV